MEDGGGNGDVDGGARGAESVSCGCNGGLVVVGYGRDCREEGYGKHVAIFSPCKEEEDENWPVRCIEAKN